MKKIQKVFIKEPFWLAFLKPIVRVFARIFWGYKMKSFYKAEKGENIIILSNHQTDLDPVLVRMSSNRYLYTIATDNIFSDPKNVKWLTRLGAIPKKKGVADLRSIFNMTSIAASGGSLLLFAEGNRSYAEFQFYIAENIGKLLKRMECTIVLFNLHGGFGSMPRFGSKKRRKGPFYGEIKRVLKYSEYENIPDEELSRIVIDNLRVIDAESGYSYKSKRRAEYLERMYFVCPKCGDIHSLKSEGNYLKCHNCGLEVEYTEKLSLKSNDSTFTWTKLNDWYEYQKQWVRDYEIQPGKIIFEDEDVTLTLSNPYQTKELLNQGKLVLTDTTLSVADTVFNLKDIMIASPVSGRNLCLTINDENYVIRGQERFNALKYVLMFNKLDTRMKKEELDKYFNI